MARPERHIEKAQRQVGEPALGWAPAPHEERRGVKREDEDFAVGRNVASCRRHKPAMVAQ